MYSVVFIKNKNTSCDFLDFIFCSRVVTFYLKNTGLRYLIQNFEFCCVIGTVKEIENSNNLSSWKRIREDLSI